MADYKKLISFILAAEGSFVNNSADKGGETNKGITWAVWVSYFGDVSASQPDAGSELKKRFMAMQAEDWAEIFKAGYWNKCFADQIVSQPVANTIVDWVWCSGQHFPELDTQKLVNTIFNQHLAEDGLFGPATIAALNSCEVETLYESLIERRRQYCRDIVSFAHEEGDHSQDIFLDGWLNRINNLIKYNRQWSVNSNQLSV